MYSKIFRLKKLIQFPRRLFLISLSLSISLATGCSGAAEGEECGESAPGRVHGGSIICDDDLVCLRVNPEYYVKRCFPKKHVGDACFDQKQCIGENTFCDFRTEPSQCRLLLKENERCMTYDSVKRFVKQCEEALSCNEGFMPPLCKLPLPLNSPCSSQSNCKEIQGKEIICKEKRCQVNQNPTP